MPLQRIKSIEYIRGISMLGVLGIHTGAYSLSNPHVNVHLFALLEIASRFSVPIFFFVSAFGLFFKQNIYERFDYGHFILRRSRSVLIPYIVWSLLYMMHYTYVYHDPLIWTVQTLGKFFLFGLASYQLYFLVILLWFYALMPFWRLLARWILKHPLRNLGLLLLLQIIFNYYSCYMIKPNFSNPYINVFIQYRLSYIVFHYIFIFMLGALFALKYQNILSLLPNYKKQIYSCFAFSLFIMLGSYYYLLNIAHYTPEQAVNTVQQLSPPGIIYTLTSSIFLFTLFSSNSLPKFWQSILDILGKYSYPIYLVHPMAMYYLSLYLAKKNLLMTGMTTIGFYISTLLTSLVFAILLNKIGKKLPWAEFLLIGKTKKSGKFP